MKWYVSFLEIPSQEPVLKCLPEILFFLLECVWTAPQFRTFWFGWLVSWQQSCPEHHVNPPVSAPQAGSQGMQWNKGSVGTHLGFYSQFSNENTSLSFYLPSQSAAGLSLLKDILNALTRPQWVGPGFQSFPTPDWKTGILKTSTNSWLRKTLLSVLVSDVLGVFSNSNLFMW